MDIIDYFDVHKVNGKNYLYDARNHRHINKNVIICDVDVDVCKFNNGFDYDGDIYYFEKMEANKCQQHILIQIK